MLKSLPLCSRKGIDEVGQDRLPHPNMAQPSIAARPVGRAGNENHRTLWLGRSAPVAHWHILLPLSYTSRARGRGPTGWTAERRAPTRRVGEAAAAVLTHQFGRADPAMFAEIIGRPRGLARRCPAVRTARGGRTDLAPRSPAVQAAVEPGGRFRLTAAWTGLHVSSSLCAEPSSRYRSSSLMPRGGNVPSISRFFRALSP